MIPHRACSAFHRDLPARSVVAADVGGTGLPGADRIGIGHAGRRCSIDVGDGASGRDSCDPGPAAGGLAVQIIAGRAGDLGPLEHRA